MKILESRPRRYDKDINILSGGHAKKIKNEIVLNWIRPGIKMLDVGCGKCVFKMSGVFKTMFK